VRQIDPAPGIGTAHALTPDEALRALGTSLGGLSHDEAQSRLKRFGPNALPRARPPDPLKIFLLQFKNPLIYVLLAAAVVSLALRDWPDAAFIFAVLLVNAAIGAFQEYGAERTANALQGLTVGRARVRREGVVHEIDAGQLVPGDVVLLESGARVPADLRLLDEHKLTIDESMLTGESLPVSKTATDRLPADCALADRVNMGFAATLVATGRARGVVVATALDTALGRIASDVMGRVPPKAPLVVRMERFTNRIAAAVGVAATLVAGVSFLRGAGLSEIFILAVALAVSAIPEGLPVALTVALAVGMKRMARRNVIVRRLVAVEALGSCTCIASDKTGTLTLNQLAVSRVQLPRQPPLEIGREDAARAGDTAMPDRLCRTAVLANEALLFERDGRWIGEGDSVDVALLVLARKARLDPQSVEAAAPKMADIPYEPEQRFAASLNRHPGGPRASVKGATETVLGMCTFMAVPGRDEVLDAESVRSQERALAAQGYRVLAIAEGPLVLRPEESFSREHLKHLTFLGLVALSDPPRPEARGAIAACRRAGIRVTMVTGDHPDTALTIARDLGIAARESEVATSRQLADAAAEGEETLDRLCAQARVFARIEPLQKLQIVNSFQRAGHFVAVTGDGVNDAPALRAAQVGVAMGRNGTDVARETAAIVITDDNFASIVAGVEEGRIAYANVRKVIFLLVSTGAAEIVLFALALLFGLPLPLVAAQLLWLNLVTNGIQDVALAFEPAEGGELAKPPRPPAEPIFDRGMIERVVLSAIVIGVIAFCTYYWMLARGAAVEEARNFALLLMVLFENVQALNARSERLSVFGHNPLRNKLLLFGTLAAQLVHIGAMFTPGLREVLGLHPVAVLDWAVLLALALVLLLAMELHKAYRRRAERASG
jgi:P-type Ca2+ transporter type 2C